MTQQEMIIPLKALAYAGIQVGIRHWRVAKEDLPRSVHRIPTFYSYPALQQRGYHAHERGGLTVVRFIALRDQFGIPQGELLVTGVARCSMVDAFDRRVGRTLALERAIDRLDFPASVLNNLDAIRNHRRSGAFEYSTPVDFATE